MQVSRMSYFAGFAVGKGRVSTDKTCRRQFSSWSLPGPRNLLYRLRPIPLFRWRGSMVSRVKILA
jgi:hypothetical protein